MGSIVQLEIIQEYKIRKHPRYSRVGMFPGEFTKQNVLSVTQKNRLDDCIGVMLLSDLTVAFPQQLERVCMDAKGSRYHL